MNILQINTVDTRGGAAKIAYTLSKQLEKFGHTTSMFVGRKYSNDPNVFLLNDVMSFSGKVRRKLAYWLANDIDVFRSDQILKTKQFKNADIIHCHNLHSNYFNLNTLIKISKLKPVVWTFHDMWPLTAHCAHSFDGKLKQNGFFTCPALEIYPPITWHNERYLENRKKNIYDHAQFHIVAVSQWLKDQVEQTLLKDKPISLIYNGIDTSVFKPYPKDDSRKLLNLPLDKKIILSVIKGGQSNPWKGADYFAQLMGNYTNHNEVLFVSVGGTQKIASNNLVLPPIQDQTMLAHYYSAADVLVYPSIADTFGLVAAEAQACGLPVVAFRTGGVPEIVDHKKTGYIAEYKNASDLKNGLDYLLNLSPQESERIRIEATDRISNNFTQEKMVKSYLDLYRNEASRFSIKKATAKW